MEIPLPLAPLVVGVTGHRDLRPEDLIQLRKLVGVQLDELLMRSPDTPLMLLSPLAEGADRLVARESLERGARLVVILPVEQKSYEKDFETEESLNEFHELLRKAETVVTLPEGPDRNRQYALAGACVARRCDVLLALWDGKVEAGTGGTAQIVRFQQAGCFDDTALQQAFQQLEEPLGPGSGLLAAPEPGLVVHIVTPRRGKPMPRQAFQVLELAPGQVGAFSEALKATHKRLNAFNEDVKTLWITTTKARKRQQEYLFPSDEASRLPKALQNLREQQATADALAIHYQKRTKRTLKILSFIVFLGATAFAYHSTLAPPGARKNPWSLALYLVLLAVAAGVHALAEHRDLHNKFLDYRAVAEGLRVQFYWRLAGLEKSTADHYLQWQRSDLEWIRHVLRPWSLAPESPESPPPFQSIKKHWIKEQADYFQKRAPQTRHQLLEFTSIRNVLLLASLAIAVFEVFHQPGSRLEVKIVVLIASLGAAALLSRSLCDLWRDLRWQPTRQIAYLHLIRGSLWAIVGLLGTGDLLKKIWRLRIDESVLDHTCDAWRMVVMGLAAVAAALVYGYAETMALSDESKQYGRMERIFGSALQKDIGRDLLEALGKEALAENGEWVLMHRERPIERPA